MIFHVDDYPVQAGAWKYEGWNQLSFVRKSNAENKSVPTQISVRCYDWGGYAMLQLTFKKKIGIIKWSTSVDTHSIPMDTNENRIVDGWQGDIRKSHKVEEKGKKVLKGGYNPAIDDEDVPVGTFQKGDGWSVYDEYRGLFLSDKDTEVTRLDPAAKDVIFCAEPTLQKYGTGSVEIPHHKIRTVIETGITHTKYVNNAFSDIWNYLTGRVPATTPVETGWVNQYSAGERRHDEIPGYAQVWAIRVKDSDRVKIARQLLRNNTGAAIQGSPSQSSLALVFTVNIESREADKAKNISKHEGIIDRQFRIAQRDDERVVLPTAAEKEAIKDVMIGVTLSHEIAHCLDLGHCAHANCVMNQKVLGKIDWKIKKADGSIEGTNTYSVNSTLFDNAHAKAYAATKAPSFNVAFITAPMPNMPPDPDQGASGTTTPDTTTPGTTPTTPTTPTYSLTSSDGVYTAIAGYGHEANFTISEAYSYVYWYVKSPSDTSTYGTNVKTETGDGSKTTSQLGCSFPSGVAGDYKITAYTYSGDGNTIYEPSYTVSVSLPSSSTAPASSTPKVTLAPGSGYTSTAALGGPYQLAVTASEPVHKIKWYWQYPSGTETLYDTQWFYDGTTTSSILNIYLFHSGTPPLRAGEHVFRVEVTPSSNSSAVYQDSYTVTVATVPDRPGSFSLSPYRVSITLRWEDSASDGGSPITDYQYQYQRKVTATGWSAWSDWTSGGTGNLAWITDLRSNRRYAVRMRAVNSIGSSSVTGIKIVDTTR